MPILRNARHEKFCLELAQGRSASEAYINAGFKASRQNAGRLRTRDDVGARVLELQGTGAKSCEVSVASLLAELEEARSKATNLNQLSAAVRATAEKAKISGLLTQKVEVSVQEADKQAEAQTVAEILADVAKRVNPEAAIALARAFKLEIRDDGEIIDTDRHTPRSIGNIRQAGNASHPSHQHAVEWQPPKPDRKHELRRTAPVNLTDQSY